MRTEERTVTVHIGTPKSGTTSLQGILARNRDLLRKRGLVYPGQNPSHFIEVLSLRDGNFRGHSYEAAEGAWRRLVEEVDGFRGSALLSHEILGGSAPKVVRELAASFPGRRIRAVITCRDLGRQVPATWQEAVKNGETTRYADFLEQALEDWDGADSAQRFWRGQNLASIARRWAKVVGTENVTLVTVPGPGAPQDVLWERFQEAVELPSVDYDLPDAPRNPSLGVVETELLRRVVEVLPDDVPWPVYTRQIKRRLAQRELVKQQSGGPLTVPEGHRAAIDEIAGTMLAALREDGFGVVGSLDELTPTYRSGDVAPDDVTDAQLLERALAVLAPMALRDRPGRPDKPSPS